VYWTAKVAMAAPGGRGGTRWMVGVFPSSCRIGGGSAAHRPRPVPGLRLVAGDQWGAGACRRTSVRRSWALKTSSQWKISEPNYTHIPVMSQDIGDACVSGHQ